MSDTLNNLSPEVQKAALDWLARERAKLKQDFYYWLQCHNNYALMSAVEYNFRKFPELLNDIIEEGCANGSLAKGSGCSGARTIAIAIRHKPVNPRANADIRNWRQCDNPVEDVADAVKE